MLAKVLIIGNFRVGSAKAGSLERELEEGGSMIIRNPLNKKEILVSYAINNGSLYLATYAANNIQICVDGKETTKDSAPFENPFNVDISLVGYNKTKSSPLLSFSFSYFDKWNADLDIEHKPNNATSPAPKKAIEEARVRELQAQKKS